MSYYGVTAEEWAMKVREVILRAMAKKITSWQVSLDPILVVSDRMTPINSLHHEGSLLPG